MSAKYAVMWAVGAIFLLAGSWIMNNLEFTLGVSDVSYTFAMIIAFVAFLLAGLFWISVAEEAGKEARHGHESKEHDIFKHMESKHSPFETEPHRHEPRPHHRRHEISDEG